MDLSQDVEVFVLIHGSFVGLVDVDVIFLPDVLDLGLHHAIMVIEAVVRVLGLANSQHKFFLDFFLCSIIDTFDVMFSLRACSLTSSSYSSGSSSYSSP